MNRKWNLNKCSTLISIVCVSEFARPCKIEATNFCGISIRDSVNFAMKIAVTVRDFLCKCICFRL